MDTKDRYYILPNIAGDGFLIIDTNTGKIQQPQCWQDLSAYHHYLLNKGLIEVSQKLLEDSMAGKKPISKMLQLSG